MHHLLCAITKGYSIAADSSFLVPIVNMPNAENLLRIRVVCRNYLIIAIAIGCDDLIGPVANLKKAILLVINIIHGRSNLILVIARNARTNLQDYQHIIRNERIRCYITQPFAQSLPAAGGSASGAQTIQEPPRRENSARRVMLGHARNSTPVDRSFR